MKLNMCFAWFNSQNPMRKMYYYHSHLIGVETEAQEGWMTPSGSQSSGVEGGARTSTLVAQLQNLSSQTLSYAAPLPPLSPLASSLHSSFYSPPLGQKKAGFYLPTSYALSTLKLVYLPYKERHGFVLFWTLFFCVSRGRLYTDVTREANVSFSHCPLQRNSGNCWDWLVAAIQLPYGDPECVLESLTQISAPPSAAHYIPEDINSMTASSGSNRSWPSLAGLPCPTGRSGAVTMVSTPCTCSCPTCGCRPWWLHTEAHPLLQGTTTLSFYFLHLAPPGDLRQTGWDRGSLTVLPTGAQGSPRWAKHTWRSIVSQVSGSSIKTFNYTV